MFAGRRIGGAPIAGRTWQGYRGPAPDPGITYYQFERIPHGIGGLRVAGPHYTTPQSDLTYYEFERFPHGIGGLRVAGPHYTQLTPIEFREGNPVFGGGPKFDWRGQRIQQEDDEIMAVIMAFLSTR